MTAREAPGSPDRRSSSPTPRSPAPYALFFASGISGFVYQVVWVRQLGNVLGNTVRSAAVVTAVFMCGLGAGSYLAGAWADRPRARDGAAPRPAAPALLFRAYGVAEVLVGVLGALLALVLPHLAGLSARLSSYAQGPRGWYELSVGSEIARHAVAALLLAPSTVLMGGTLTLLVRHEVAGALGRAGWRIGALYGLRTAGAALGCLLTDFALVSSLGLVRTQLVAAGIDLVVGALAITLASRSASAPAPAAPPIEAPAPAASDHGVSRRAVALTAGAIALTGFAGMGLEIVWYRVLASSLGPYRAVFSLLLAVMLAATWAGSMLGGWLHRRLGRPAATYLVVQVLFVVSTLALLAAYDRTDVDRYLALAWRARGSPDAGLPPLSQDVATVRVIAFLVGLPALLSGCSFPLANAAVQRLEAEIGRRTGALYLASTAGSVLGSLAAGFVLVPLLGAQRSVFWLAFAAAAAVVPLYLSLRRPIREQPQAGPDDFVLAGAVLALFVALTSWSALVPGDHVRRRSLERLRGERYLTIHEGPNELLAVSVAPDGVRRLWANGQGISSNHPEAQRALRAAAHVPLLEMEAPRSALVIGFGAGNTAHAASLHPSLDHLDVVDPSRDVLDHAGWFGVTNGRVLDSPRVRVLVNDGRQHLRMTPPGAYDLVTLEPPPPGHAGASSLYARDFYELCRSRLAPGGFVTQGLPVEQLPGPASLAIVRAFLDVFPAAVLLSGDRHDLILMGTTGPSIAIDPAVLARRLVERPLVAQDLARVEMGTPAEIIGSFAAGADALARATAGVAPVTDDRPSLEYAVMSKLFVTEVPRGLFDVGGVAAWCPACAASPVPDLAAHLQVLGRLYEDEAFLRYRSFVPADVVLDLPPLLEGDDGSVAQAILRGAYLRRIVGIDPHGRPTALRPDELAALEALRGRVHGAAEALVALRLGLAYAAERRLADAVAALRRAIALDPASAQAELGLAAVWRAGNQLDLAVEAYRRGLDLAPGDVTARVALADTLLAANKGDLAAIEVGKVLDVDPDNGQALKLVCAELARAGRLDEARVACARAEAGGATLPMKLHRLILGL